MGGHVGVPLSTEHRAKLSTALKGRQFKPRNSQIGVWLVEAFEQWAKGQDASKIQGVAQDDGVWQFYQRRRVSEG